MTSLTKYNEACRAVAAAKSFDEVKDIASKAEAMRAYAVQAKNRELEVDAAEIRIRAERRLGEMIAAIKADGSLYGGRNSPVSLSSIGVSRNMSMRSQRLAAQDASVFEAGLASWRDRTLSEGIRAKSRLGPAVENRDRRSGEASAFRLLDGTSIGRVKLGNLRSRCVAAQAEARLLASILNHVQGADALATVGDTIKESVLAGLIADAIEVRS